MHLHLAGPLQRLEGGDGTHQLHAVVGGLALAARELLARAVVIEDGAPAAGARIAGAGPVRMHDHLVRGHVGAFASRSSRGSLKETFSSRSVTVSTLTS